MAGNFVARAEFIRKLEGKLEIDYCKQAYA